MPRIEKFPVSFEYEGKVYSGEQIVEGIKHRYQKVVFEGRTKHDSYRGFKFAGSNLKCNA